MLLTEHIFKKCAHLALVQVPDTVEIVGTGVDPMRLVFGVNIVTVVMKNEDPLFL